jgi:hypothetical protein
MYGSAFCNGYLNRVFVVAGMKYLPRPEPAACESKKWKVVASLKVNVIWDKKKDMKKWARASL